MGCVNRARYVEPRNHVQRNERDPDRAAAELAAAQYGVLARSQLAELGLERWAIERRVQRGRLHVVHRGIYAVGHRRLSRPGRWMAAALAGGTGAALSHHHGGALWVLLETSRQAIDVTVPLASGGLARA